MWTKPGVQAEATYGSCIGYVFYVLLHCVFSVRHDPSLCHQCRRLTSECHTNVPSASSLTATYVLLVRRYPPMTIDPSSSTATPVTQSSSEDPFCKMHYIVKTLVWYTYTYIYEQHHSYGAATGALQHSSDNVPSQRHTGLHTNIFNELWYTLHPKRAGEWDFAVFNSTRCATLLPDI